MKVLTLALLVIIAAAMLGTAHRTSAYTYDSETALLSQTASNAYRSLTAHHPSAAAAASATGESFRSVNGNWSITKLAFNLTKLSGAPTTNLTANLYLSSGNTPTGSILAVSNPINSSSLTSSFAWYNFTLSTPYMIMNGTWYCAELQTTADGTIDMTNRVYVYDQGSNVIEGSPSDYYSSAWHLESGYDLDIIIYGQRVKFNVVFHVSGGQFLVNSTITSDGYSANYYGNDILNLSETATLGAWLNFTWDTGSSTSSPYLLSVTNDLTIYCYFDLSKFNITIYWNNASGGVSANSTTCSNGSILVYYNQSSIFLSATTSSGASIVFANWTYNGGSSTSNPFTLAIDQNCTIWCYFNIVSSGSVQRDPKFELAGTVVAAIIAIPVLLAIFVISRRRR